MASPQHQSSQQSNPSISSLQHTNQPDFSLRLQLQRLRQDLAHAQKQIQEYEDLFASLYNNICVKCKPHFEKYAPAGGLATSATTGPVVVSPSSESKFSLHPSNSSGSSAPSNPLSLWHRFFKGHTAPIRPTDSPTSLLETSTSIPNQLDWSVNFNRNIKPALNVKLEHVLTPGTIVVCVRFSPGGKYLAVGVKNGRTYIYDVKTGVGNCFLADNYETRKQGIRSLCFSPDGRYLAVGSSGGQLRIWEIAKKRTRNVFRGHTSTVEDLDFSPDGRFLVSCSSDKMVRIWRMRDGFSKLLEDKNASSVKFNLDGGYIVTGNRDGMLRIWNVWTSQLVDKWTAHGDLIWSLVFTLDGKGLVSSSPDGTWKYWDISLLDLGSGMAKDSTAGRKNKVMAHTNTVYSISISPDDKWVVSGSEDGAVRIWDLHNAVLQCTLKGHKDRVWSVDFCPTGNYLAAGSADGQVALWRYESA